MSETPLHGGGGPAPRHLTGFSEVLKQEPHGALLWKESNSILACLGVSRCPASCPLSRGFVCSACPASVPSFHQYRVPGQGLVPCVTLAEPGRPCPPRGPEPLRGPASPERRHGAGGWVHTLLLALMLLRHMCIRAQGLGEATLELTPVTPRGKAFWGDRARLWAGQAGERSAGLVRCHRRKGGARSGRASLQQEGLSTQPPAWKAGSLDPKTGPRLDLPT